MKVDQRECLNLAKTLFKEAYEGPSAQWSWFTNVSPDAGIFALADALNADQASKVANGADRSIAAHIEHLRWSLALTNDTLQGKPWNPDWSASWSVSRVSDEQWKQLRSDLRRAVNEVCASLDAFPAEMDEMMLTGILSLAPHAAHHLGTMRMMAKHV